MKRYGAVWFPDTGHDDGRVEMHEFALGEYIKVVDLPVEVLLEAAASLRREISTAATMQLPDHLEGPRKGYIEKWSAAEVALRDLLLAIRPA